jgi:hypothetical protein
MFLSKTSFLKLYLGGRPDINSTKPD